MQFVPLAISAVGVLGKTVAGMNAASGQSRALKKEAQLTQQAHELEAQGEQQALALDQSKVNASYGAGNIVSGEGSALDVILHNARTAARRVEDIRNEGKLKAFSKREQARLVNASKSGIAFGGMVESGSIATELFKKLGY